MVRRVMGLQSQWAPKTATGSWPVNVSKASFKPNKNPAIYSVRPFIRAEWPLEVHFPQTRQGGKCRRPTKTRVSHIGGFSHTQTMDLVQSGKWYCLFMFPSYFSPSRGIALWGSLTRYVPISRYRARAGEEKKKKGKEKKRKSPNRMDIAVYPIKLLAIKGRCTWNFRKPGPSDNKSKVLAE
jgi:hypothetical protein